ncbi:MAG TPA: hypothetical protein V6D28_04395 [Leptolyngbyaceae cyanobacterium]
MKIKNKVFREIFRALISDRSKLSLSKTAKYNLSIPHLSLFVAGRSVNPEGKAKGVEDWAIIQKIDR